MLPHSSAASRPSPSRDARDQCGCGGRRPSNSRARSAVVHDGQGRPGNGGMYSGSGPTNSPACDASVAEGPSTSGKPATSLPTGGPVVSSMKRTAPATPGHAATPAANNNDARKLRIFSSIPAIPEEPRPSGQSIDRPDRATQRPNQASHQHMVRPPQRRYWHPRRASQTRPAGRPEASRIRMARRGKRRREKRKAGARSPCAAQLGGRVCRTGQPAAPDARVARPAPTPQMHPRPQRRRQAHVPRHDKRQPARLADADQVAAQRDTMRIPVMPQNHPRQSRRQPRNRGPRIRQPPFIGE